MNATRALRLAGVMGVLALLALGCRSGPESADERAAGSSLSGSGLQDAVSSNPGGTSTPSSSVAVGVVSTLAPANDYERAIVERRIVPSAIDLSCSIEFATDGFGDELGALTDMPATPPKAAFGSPLRYKGKPVTLVDPERFAWESLADDWVILNVGSTARAANGSALGHDPRSILARVDPATGEIRGDTYRISGCAVGGLTSGATGDWITLCSADGAEPRGAPIKLDKSSTTADHPVGLLGTCPRITAAGPDLWLHSHRTTIDARSSNVLRLWRLTPAGGDQWLTIDIADTAPNMTPAASPSSPTIWNGTTAIYGEPPTSHGPVALSPTPSSSPDLLLSLDVSDGLMWFVDGGTRLLGVDDDLRTVRSVPVPGLLAANTGAPGMLVQTAPRGPDGRVSPDATITFARVDAETGAIAPVATLPAIPVDQGRTGTPSGFVGRPYRVILDREGGWIIVDGTPTRIPPAWFGR